MTAGDSISETDLRIQALRQRLARENRCLLFMLRMGYTLREAEQVLREAEDVRAGQDQPGIRQASRPKGRSS